MITSRSFFTWFLGGPLLLACSTLLVGQSIAPSGSTSIHATTAGKKVDLAIRAARIESSSEIFPNIESGAKSVTLITDLQLTVNGARIFVPRSVFADLLDPRTTSIRPEKSDILLTISGGDGAESYFVSIIFDSMKVKRRLLYSTLTPTVPSQVTTYTLSVLKDE
jgi:hypothetical protein